MSVRAVQCLQSMWGLLAEAGPAQSPLGEALGIPDGCELQSEAVVGAVLMDGSAGVGQRRHLQWLWKISLSVF